MKSIVITGQSVILINKEEWEKSKSKISLGWFDYDISLIEIHIANCGYGILDKETETPIDNEYILDEIYTRILADE